MKLTGSAYVSLAIMAFMLVVIVLSINMQFTESRLLPLMISSVVFVLAAVGLGGEIKTQHGTKATMTGDKGAGNEEAVKGWRGNLIAGAWVVGFFVAVYLIGFLIAIPLFILSYTKSHGTGWLVAIILTVVTTVIIYGVFEVAFAIELYRGLIFGGS